MARFRLLVEVEDGAVGVDVDETVVARVVHGVEAEAEPGLPPLVGLPQRGQVEVGQHVAVQREETLLEVGRRKLDRARGAERLRFDQVAQPRAAAGAVSEHFLELVGKEAAGEHDLVNAVRSQPIDHVAEERPVDQGQDRFRGVGGQRLKAGALPSDQNQCLQSRYSVSLPVPGRPMPS